MPIKQLEIGHAFYGDYRLAELVCRTCHEKVDFSKELLSLEQMIKQRLYPERFSIFVFEKDTSLMTVVTKKGKKINLFGFGKVPPKRQMKAPMLLNL